MNRTIAEALLDTLAARRGIVAVVGAGGKKTTLCRLLQAHRISGTKRGAMTTTVPIAPPLGVEQLVAEAGDILDLVRAGAIDDGFQLIAAPSPKPGRLAGLPLDLIKPLHLEGRFEITLVKADGARMRMIKAPNEEEPALPPGTTTVLPIVSAKAFGQPLSSRWVHRPECLSAVVDAPPDTILTPRHIATLLCHDKGALRGVGDAEVVPIINMADTPERLEAARAAARIALTITDRFDRIVLASMISETPMIDVVSRRA